MSKKNISAGCFCLGLLVLSFIAGSASMYYRVQGISDFFTQAFTGVSGWVDEVKISMLPRIPVSDLSDSAISKAKVQWDSQAAYKGYTLLTLRSNKIYLVDMEGKTVHGWDAPFYKVFGNNPGHIAEHIAEDNTYIAKAYAYANGDLLVLYQGVTMPYGFGLAKLDKASHVIWTYKAAAHHDFYVADDGFIYTLVHNFYDAREGGAPLPYGLAMKLPSPLIEDNIVALSPDGKEVNRTSILQALANSPYAAALLHGDNDLDFTDVTHANAVVKLEPNIAAKFPQFHAGQVLVSLRNMSALAVLDLTQHKLVWFEKGPWAYQHDASFQPDGTILMLDNLGQEIQGKAFSRLLKILPSTGQVVWDYSGNQFFTYGGGRVQSLPGGNMLVGETLNGHIFEITTVGKTVWDYRIPLYYAPRIIGFPPYGEDKKRNLQTGFSALNPNLVTAITSARRYSPEEIRFLP